VFQPGYVFHGRVLRPAMVRVAVHPNPASKEAVKLKEIERFHGQGESTGLLRSSWA